MKELGHWSVETTGALVVSCHRPADATGTITRSPRRGSIPTTGVPASAGTPDALGEPVASVGGEEGAAVSRAVGGINRGAGCHRGGEVTITDEVGCAWVGGTARVRTRGFTGVLASATVVDGVPEGDGTVDAGLGAEVGIGACPGLVSVTATISSRRGLDHKTRCAERVRGARGVTSPP